MKKLQISYLPGIDPEMPLEEISAMLDKQDKLNIDNAPWPAYSYRPSAKFALVHSGDCLFLKFYVSEETIRARYRQTNDPVFKDSCVEFFISFGEEAKYYNLEFNCLGTCRAAFGAGRENRAFLPEKIIAQIRRVYLLAGYPNSVRSTPGLHPVFGHHVAGGQYIQLLQNVIDGYFACKPGQQLAFKIFDNRLPDYKNYPIKTSLNGVVNRVIDNGFAVWPKFFQLF